MKRLITLLLFSFCFSGATARAEILADSAADFNFDGEHDPEGWTMGYRNLAEDEGGEDYDAEADFIPFPDDWWNGTAWDEPNADGDNVPWTVIGQESTHPNGDNNGEIHWTIRRWAPQIENPTPLALQWEVRKQNVNCGNGVTGSLHVNGKRVDFLTIEGNDDVGEVRTYYQVVLPGDVIDVALSPLGVDDTNADGCDGSFTFLTVDSDIPNPAIQPNGDLFVFDQTDTDGDSLPDQWEFSFFEGDLTKLSGDGDFDEDGSTDENEFLSTTDPTNADSDGDGLSDGVETGTGTFVSADDTGSNPREADTDGDTLSDSAEVLGDPSTDPNNANTDGDDYDDAQELACGTDPNDGNTDCSDGEIANSEADWSTDGEFGVNGWSYGYRNLTAEGDVEKVDYDPATEFILFDEAEGWIWRNNGWDWEDGNVPWTWINPTNTHPNGDNNGDVHWSVRRWEANVQDTTPVAIRWFTAKQNTNCGNGVTGAVHINGVRQFDALTVASDDGDGEEIVFYANVNPGDAVDLINSPLGDDDPPTNADGCDGSVNWMRVSTVIPAVPTQPDGSIFEPFIPGDPGLGYNPNSPFSGVDGSEGAVTETVILSNVGEIQDLVISAANLTGADRDHYSFDADLPITIAPGGTHELAVTFDPGTEDGLFDAALVFTSNDENRPERTLNLSANIPDRNQLVAWYKLDETDGTTMNDSSGKGNHGTFVPNGATLELGAPGIAGGTALRLAPNENSAAYAEVPGFDPLDAGFTMSVWFQADATLDPTVAGILSKNDEQPGSPFALAGAGGQVVWFGDGAEAPDAASGDGTLVLEQTHHVVVTYDPAGPLVKLYLDGALASEGTDDGTVTDVRAALQIGTVNGVAGWAGLIDDIQIYGKVLSDDDVTWLNENPGSKLGQDEIIPPAGDPMIGEVILTEDGIAFDLSGTEGGVDVEYSIDLMNWEVIASGVTEDRYEDTDAARLANPQGYYRVGQ